MGLFQNKGQQIKDTCHFFPIFEDKDFLSQLNDNNYALFASTRQQLYHECGNGRVSTFEVDGMMRVTLEPGCTVNTESFSFGTGPEMYSDPIGMEFISLNTQELFKPEEVSILKAELSRLSKVGSKEGVHWPNLKAGFDREREESYLWWALSTVLSIIGGVVLLLVVCRCLNLRTLLKKRKRRRTEDSQVNIQLSVMPTPGIEDRDEPPEHHEERETSKLYPPLSQSTETVLA